MAYVLPLDIGDLNLLIGAGIYPPITAADVLNRGNLQQFVERAAAALSEHTVDRETAHAFLDANFRDEGEWRHEDIYVFVLTMEGINFFQAPDPDWEGTDVSDLADLKGVMLGQELLAGGSGPAAGSSSTCGTTRRSRGTRKTGRPNWPTRFRSPSAKSRCSSGQGSTWTRRSSRPDVARTPGVAAFRAAAGSDFDRWLRFRLLRPGTAVAGVARRPIHAAAPEDAAALQDRAEPEEEDGQRDHREGEEDDPECLPHFAVHPTAGWRRTLLERPAAEAGYMT